MSDRKPFHWGRVIAEHAIGPYRIVEYAEVGASNHPTHPREETGRTLFHGFIEADDCCESWLTLDHALVGLIGRRHGDYRSGEYAALVLGLDRIGKEVRALDYLGHAPPSKLSFLPRGLSHD